MSFQGDEKSGCSVEVQNAARREKRAEYCNDEKEAKFKIMNIRTRMNADKEWRDFVPCRVANPEKICMCTCSSKSKV